ncbi:SDR family NAD(P)-dependent oxidoreductase [Ochrobactrum sp. EDr1-4]|uniref:SDR family NAD(P)-dependent oxidoreductase n=1 Tax=Ochrobactrum sp. EDr1-4 TaxID=3368622 RepID=UPI003B9DE5B7
MAHENMILDQFSLHGKVALITGSGRGIGFALAQGFSQAGATVIINDINPETAKTAAAALNDAGGKAFALPFDVTDFDAAEKAVDAIVAEHGRIDILMNNAGILIRQPVEAHDMNAWNKVININLSSLYALARACAIHMKKQKYGRIISTASVMAISSRPGVISYVAAKHGVVGLTRGLAAELGPDNITVNAIGPGYILTEMNSKVLNSAFEQQVIDRTPLARWAKPEELQGAAVFLASDAASFVTGQVLMVDGGMTSNSILTPSVDLGLAS